MASGSDGERTSPLQRPPVSGKRRFRSDDDAAFQLSVVGERAARRQRRYLPDNIASIGVRATHRRRHEILQSNSSSARSRGIVFQSFIDIPNQSQVPFNEPQYPIPSVPFPGSVEPTEDADCGVHDADAVVLNASSTSSSLLLPSSHVPDDGARCPGVALTFNSNFSQDDSTPTTITALSPSSAPPTHSTVASVVQQSTAPERNNSNARQSAESERNNDARQSAESERNSDARQSTESWRDNNARPWCPRCRQHHMDWVRDLMDSDLDTSSDSDSSSEEDADAGSDAEIDQDSFGTPTAGAWAVSPDSPSGAGVVTQENDPQDAEEDDSAPLLLSEQTAASIHLSEEVCPIIVLNKEEAVGETCCICLDEMKHGHLTRKLPCGHGNHLTCIDTWLEGQSTCPMCRTTII